MRTRSRQDWAGYDPDKIPTKPDLAHVDRWLATLAPGARVLDVGCGTGGVSRLLLERGCRVVGIDINGAAIDALSRAHRDVGQARFLVRDVASAAGLALGGERFDGAVCQLVASIVGDADDRAQLVRNVHDALVPAGKLSISFSGLSDDINPAYAALYAEDLQHTGEHGTYLSRDGAGRVLYATHHFAAAEIRDLLQGQGFRNLQLEERIETSSRRADQAARFYYATCARGD